MTSLSSPHDTKASRWKGTKKQSIINTSSFHVLQSKSLKKLVMKQTGWVDRVFPEHRSRREISIIPADFNPIFSLDCPLREWTGSFVTVGGEISSFYVVATYRPSTVDFNSTDFFRDFFRDFLRVARRRWSELMGRLLPGVKRGALFSRVVEVVSWKMLT